MPAFTIWLTLHTWHLMSLDMTLLLTSWKMTWTLLSQAATSHGINRPSVRDWGGDGMTEDLLTDATAPDSLAKKMKKRLPCQSKPLPTK